ncbi:sugar ABC transporter permease [Eubacteriales bacterium OttesenSCG-928-N13]|nr:sugar ABC transporter permease [Eubacteriales bacterium OttesenSCG-928-N13]
MRRMKKMRGAYIGEASVRRTAMLMIAPAMVIILGMNVYPLLYNVGLSFFWYNLLDTAKNGFAGVRQFVEVFTNKGFGNSLLITGYFAVVSLVVQTVLGTLIALLLNMEFKGRGFVRAIVLLPWAVPSMVNAAIWGWILNANYGLLNRVLLQWGVIKEIVVWMATAFSALNMIILADTWRMLPLTVLLLLAALQTLDASTIEAGIVDGANAFQRFWHIKLPLMKPLLLVLLIMRTTQTIKVFDIIFMMTGGGPGNGTMAISFYTYYAIFKNLNYGTGATLSVAISVIILLIAVLYLKVLHTDDPS